MLMCQNQPSCFQSALKIFTIWCLNSWNSTAPNHPPVDTSIVVSSLMVIEEIYSLTFPINSVIQIRVLNLSVLHSCLLNPGPAFSSWVSIIKCPMYPKPLGTRHNFAGTLSTSAMYLHWKKRMQENNRMNHYLQLTLHHKKASISVYSVSLSKRNG